MDIVLLNNENQSLKKGKAESPKVRTKKRKKRSMAKETRKRNRGS